MRLLVGLELGYLKCTILNIVGDKKNRWLVDAATTFTADGVQMEALQPAPPRFWGTQSDPRRAH